MNPKPFAELKNLTCPIGMAAFSVAASAAAI
jgi:hypothetical protein